MTAIEVVPGLCSITFRQLDVEQIVALAQRAGVGGIEWGADVHVPPGDETAARDAARRCADAGIAISSYGSYLGTGPSEGTQLAHEIDQVLDTAEALGTGVVRIWTAFGVVPGSPEADRREVVERTRAIAERARQRGVVLALEFHPATMTDTAASTVALLDEVAAPNLLTHWQPDPRLTPLEALAGLDQVLPRLAYLHVFSWGPAGIAERLPLAEGGAVWPEALAAAASVPCAIGPRYALCEYVADDEPEHFVRDVATLRRWIAASA